MQAIDDMGEYSAYGHVDPSDKFSVEKLFAFPGPFKEFDNGGRRKEVCIVGGGIAGLTAAYELASLDHEVTVLEATGRWGGRILTHRFPDGTYGELGAMRIPHDHKCVEHYVDDFGLKKPDFVNVNSEAFYLLRGICKRRAEWYEIAKAFNIDSKGTYFKQPSVILAGVVNDTLRLSGLTGSDSLKWEQFSNRMNSPQLRGIEDRSLGQVVRGALRPFGPKLPDDVWEYAGRSTNDLWLEQTSMLHWLRENNTLKAGKFEIEGGMDLLVEGFLARFRTLKTRPILMRNSRVVDIKMLDDYTEVTWQRISGRTTRRFHYVICAVPAKATAEINFSPVLDHGKVEALTNLSYLSAGKTLMRCRLRHWELDDGIYGGQSVTDLLNQQCWYPSDNSKEIPDDELEHKSHEVLETGWEEIDEPRTEKSDWKAKNPNLSQEPGVFLAAYMWGDNAKRFASMSDTMRTEEIISNVAMLHENNEEHLEDIVHWSWDEQSNPGGGAFAWFAPGEQSRYQKALCDPALNGNGDPIVFFAGEHIGISHGWIQTAMQTALSAVIKVLELP